jgi:hypothetical protein
MKKNSLHYELYGSSTGAEKKGILALGHFRRARKKATAGRLILWHVREGKRTCDGGNIASERTYSETQTASLKIVERKLSPWVAQRRGMIGMTAKCQ